MDEITYSTLGNELYEAFLVRKPIEAITNRYGGITVDDAYRIQQQFIGRRLQAGEKVVGKKIGLTSKAVRDSLGVYQPDFGQILDGMVFGQGSEIAMSTMIQPMAEGEIAFLLKRDLLGPGISAADILSATEGVMACFEIVDSRVKDWKIKLADTVADNASCGVLVLGDRLVDPRNLDLYSCGMVLEKGGRVAVTGAGAATMNSPLNAMAWLCNTLGKLGIPLKAGEIVLSGALGGMVPVAAGDNLRVTVGGIGSCSVNFV